MSTIETFFAFSFASTIAVALLATGYRCAPMLISLYRVLVYQQNQPISPKYDLDELKFCTVNDGEG